MFAQSVKFQANLSDFDMQPAKASDGDNASLRG